MTNSYQAYLDGECSLSEFKATLNLIKPELGKVYKQLSSSWSEMHYEIIFQDANISIGKCIYNAISNKFIGDYEMFNTRDGFKYNDTRYNYRLIGEVVK